jgi:hypothetical protein
MLTRPPAKPLSRTTDFRLPPGQPHKWATKGGNREGIVTDGTLQEGKTGNKDWLTSHEMVAQLTEEGASVHNPDIQCMVQVSCESAVTVRNCQ